MIDPSVHYYFSTSPLFFCYLRIHLSTIPFFFFLNDPAPTEISPLPLHAALPFFPPFAAIAFCGAVYFRDKRLWFLPFAGLCLTDLYINWFYAREYGYHLEWTGYVGRIVCYALGLGLGSWVSTRKSWLWLLNGSLLGAVLFYTITNTLSWSTDAFYAKTLAGWWQALTIGHPEY